MQDYTAILEARRQAAKDPYQNHLRTVLLHTSGREYMMGMILWLETAHPDLYLEITSRLPDLIHDLWITRAPISEFERATATWLAAHRRACALFQESHAGKEPNT